MPPTKTYNLPSLQSIRKRTFELIVLYVHAILASVFLTFTYIDMSIWLFDKQCDVLEYCSTPSDSCSDFSSVLNSTNISMIIQSGAQFAKLWLSISIKGSNHPLGFKHKYGHSLRTINHGLKAIVLSSFILFCDLVAGGYTLLRFIIMPIKHMSYPSDFPVLPGGVTFEIFGLLLYCVMLLVSIAVLVDTILVYQKHMLQSQSSKAEHNPLLQPTKKE